MAIAIVINFNNNIDPGIRFGPADHWDGYSENMARNVFGGIFQGYCLNWGSFISSGPINSFNHLQYSGYNTNFDANETASTTDALANSKYAGYTTNWGKYVDPINKSVDDVDMDTIINHPKADIIYYKLKGWNAMTLQYESWVVSHDVTSRVALDGNTYDPNPGRQAPNVERDVFKTPPSGNTLSNIIIVARWFE